MTYHEYQSFKVQTLPPTPSDIEGPFYKAGAPESFSGMLFDPPNLRVWGNVLDIQGKAIIGAVLDIWQADYAGAYDNDGFKLRGKIKSGTGGQYSFKTIVPGDYQIAEDPPDFRCAHIHVKVTSDGFKPLTTQLYFPDDKYNATDHWFDQRRVIPANGNFDFVLERA